MLILLTILSSILNSFCDLLNKKTANKISDFGFVWLISFCTLPIYFLAYLIFGEFRPIEINPRLILTLISGIIILFAARLAIRKAFDKADLSMVSPISGFTPIFSLIIGIFALNEVPSTVGYIGIFCVFLGSFVANFKALKQIHYSIPKFIQSPGVLLTLIADFLYSFYFLINKLAVEQLGIFNWLLLLHGSIVILFSFKFLTAKKPEIQSMIRGMKSMSLYAIFNAFSIILSLIVISQIYLVYYTSLMQVYILINVFVGHFLLKEEGFVNRLAGSSIIFAGLLLIGIYG